MNMEEIYLGRKVKFIQVYRQIHIYGKENKSFEERKSLNAWQPIESYFGHFSKGSLYLPEGILEHKDLSNINLILLVDDNPGSLSIEKKSAGIIFYNLSHSKKWGIFEFQLKENVELHLKYDHFDIGEPARENFKLCDLKPAQPVEVQINGKLDFSLSSRRARSYKVQSYIFEYIDQVDKVRLMESPYTPIIKNVPAKRKVINLLKPLW